MFLRADQTLGPVSAALSPQLAAAASDIALVLDRTGVVIDATVEPNGKKGLAQTDWIDRPFVDLVTPDTRIKVESMIEAALEGQSPRWRQVNHPLQGRGENAVVPVDYMAIPLEHEGHIFLLGRDLSGMAALQQRLIKSQQAMERDYQRFRAAETRYRQLFSSFRRGHSGGWRAGPCDP